MTNYKISIYEGGNDPFELPVLEYYHSGESTLSVKIFSRELITSIREELKMPNVFMEVELANQNRNRHNLYS